MIIELYDLDDYIYHILIGKNAEENWKLIDDASENDIWFHLDNYPSPHVILKIPVDYNLKKVPRKVLTRCANLCKIHSKYNNIKKINIIYTKIKNIKKGDHVGSVITQNTSSIVI